MVPVATDWPCGDFSREPPNFQPWWEDAALRPLRAENATLQMGLEPVILGTLSLLLPAGPHFVESRLFSKRRRGNAGGFRSARFHRNEISRYQRSRRQRLDDRRPGSVHRPELVLQQRHPQENLSHAADRSFPRKSVMRTATRCISCRLFRGTSRITLSITQPLLNGAGKAYNSRLISAGAGIDAQSAAQPFVEGSTENILLVAYQMRNCWSGMA